MKVVGYIRVSSDSQIENTSLHEQEERIRAYCKARGWKVDKIFSDEGKSGSTINDRQGYKDMIVCSTDKNNQIGAVVVLKADRVHRRLMNLLKMLEEDLKPCGVEFISVVEGFDTTTSQGTLFLQMIGSFSEFERAVINERTRNGRVKTAKNGGYAGGRPPFGYKNTGDGLAVIEAEIETVKRIFKERKKGKTLHLIADILNEGGFTLGKKWTKQNVRRILQNRIYKGVYTYNGKVEKNNIVVKDKDLKMV